LWVANRRLAAQEEVEISYYGFDQVFPEYRSDFSNLLSGIALQEVEVNDDLMLYLIDNEDKEMPLDADIILDDATV
jgi:hypothetical protein